MVKKCFKLFLVLILVLSIFSVFAAALPEIPEVGAIKESSGQTLKERCLAAGYSPECCNPPDYQESPGCSPSDEAQLSEGELASLANYCTGIGLEASLCSSTEREFTYPRSNKVYNALMTECHGQGKALYQCNEIYQTERVAVFADFNCVNVCDTDGDCSRCYEKEGAAVSEFDRVVTLTAYDAYVNVLKAAAAERSAGGQEAVGEIQAEAVPASKFDSLEKQAVRITPGQAVDSDGRVIPLERLEEGLDKPTAQLKSVLNNIPKGQPFTQEMPLGLTLQKFIGVPADAITNAEMVFTLNEKPIDLKIPEPSRYETVSYFGLDFIANRQEVQPLSEALFYIKQPGGTLLRYDVDKRDWSPLPVAFEDYAEGFVAKSSGNSHFAIVLEKESEVIENNKGDVVEKEPESQGASSWVWILIALIAVAAAGYYFLKMRKK